MNIKNRYSQVSVNNRYYDEIKITSSNHLEEGIVFAPYVMVDTISFKEYEKRQLREDRIKKLNNIKNNNK